MGICESSHRKSFSKEIYSYQKQEFNPNDQTMDYKNISQEESGNRPSFLNQSENKNSLVEEIKANNKPELAKYDRSLLGSAKRSEYSHNNNINKTSLFSSAHSEEELIIKGEINKDVISREKDFVNSSFKNEVENKGGKIIKDDDINNNINGSIKVNSIFNPGKENNTEIDNNTNVIKRNINNINNNNEIVYGIINGKYDQNGNLIPNDNNIKYNERYNNEKVNINKNIIEVNNNILKKSYKINISLHESCPRIESFLNVPKTDQPPPNIDEISENMLRNSLESG